MVYIESKPRSLQEQQDYEISMKSKWEKSTTRRAGANNFSELKHLPRRAKKYVIFDAETGEVVFEYGGVQNKRISVSNANNQMVEIYELGMMIQQIRDNDYRPEFYFFLAGDFWDKAFKNSS